MKYVIASTILIAVLASCKARQEGSGDYDKYDPAKTYKLRLNPSAGSVYEYEITNETETNAEAEEKTIKSINRSNANVTYKVDQDSSGNILLSTTYNKILIYAKSGDKETELNADNTGFGTTATEKMLGILKNSTVVATLNSTGEIQSMSGYREIGEKILAAFPETDDQAKAAIRAEWEKSIGEGFIKKNLEQLFKMFPDSSIHLGDEWRLTSVDEDALGITVKNSYKLKAINSEIAIIESKGVINSDSAAASATVMGGTLIDLKGEQNGEFEMETKTGMLISCKLKAKIAGVLQVMGRGIPVTITTHAEIKGRKTK